MASESQPIDISTIPELARLVDEVQRTNRPRRLRRDNTDVAILSPARFIPSRRRGKAVNQADIDASLAAVGSWQGLVDAEQLKADLDAARSDARPLTEL